MSSQKPTRHVTPLKRVMFHTPSKAKTANPAYFCNLGCYDPCYTKSALSKISKSIFKFSPWTSLKTAKLPFVKNPNFTPPKWEHIAMSCEPNSLPPKAGDQKPPTKAVSVSHLVILGLFHQHRTSAHLESPRKLPGHLPECLESIFFRKEIESEPTINLQGDIR